MKKKVTLDNFQTEYRNTLNSIKNEILSPDNLQKVGDDLAEQIKVRTRLGNGLDESQGEPSKLKPLSNSYIKERTTMQLSELTTPKKSNLTQTGAMLDDIVAKIEDNKIVITFKNQFSKDKARWNTEKGRAFLNISRVQVDRLKNEINSLVLKLLKKY